MIVSETRPFRMSRMVIFVNISRGKLIYFQTLRLLFHWHSSSMSLYPIRMTVLIICLILLEIIVFPLSGGL